MVDSRELYSVLFVLEFVAVAAAVCLLVPFDAAVPLVPLVLVLLFPLALYVRSRYRGGP